MTSAVAQAADVLEEFKQVKQEPGAGRRRWFSDDGLELILWFGAAEQPEGFQLCYETGPHEHALTWRTDRGFTHARVDTGDTRPDKNLTPVLTQDGAVPWEWIQTNFAARSGAVPAALRAFVLQHLRDRH